MTRSMIFLPDAIVNSDRIEEVITLLEKHNIKLEEEDINLEIEEVKPGKDRKKLIYSDKESSVDDPIRLYLREIGKENLLTAEQEVELSKAMESGENIIKGVIKDSGVLVREFLRLGMRAAHARSRDMNLSKKEATGVPGRDEEARGILQGALQGPPARRETLHGAEAPDGVRGRGHF